MGEHREKWLKAMILKHGSEEAVREFMARNASKSSRNNKGTGGFRYIKDHDPDKLREISRKGVEGRRANTA